MTNESTQVATENATGAEQAAEQVVKAVRQDIVRGTLPHALVYLIRFNEQGNKESEVAKKYGTTSGKVADILKNRNFAYIDQTFKPTAAQAEAALQWLKQVPGYDEVGTDTAVVALQALGTASDDEAKAFAAARAASRSKSASSTATDATATGEAGGDKPKAARKGKASKATSEAQPATQESVDSLLS